MHRRVLAGAAALLFTLMAAGCGGGDDDKGSIRVRLVNASTGYAKLDMKSGDSVLSTAVARDSAGAFATVSKSAVSVDLLATDSATVLLRPPVDSVAKDEAITILAFGESGALRHLAVVENEPAPSNTDKVKIVPASVTGVAEPLDVYLTAEATDLSSVAPTVTGLVSGRMDTARELAKGAYRLRVTAAGSKTDIRMDTAGVSFEGGKVYTLALSGINGSPMVNALQLPHGGSLTRLQNAVASVRVVAALPRTASVSARIGSRIFLPEIAAPAISAYQTQTAAPLPMLSWSVDGMPRLDQSLALQPNARYSVLIWGTTDAPLVSLLREDTTAPAVGTAKLRVLHAATGLGPVTLSLNLAPTLSAVAPGQLVETAVTNLGDEQQIAVRAGTTVVLSQIRRLVAGQTYTIYLTGAPGAIEAQILQQ